MFFDTNHWEEIINLVYETKDVWIDVFDLYGVDYNSIFTYNIVATKELDTAVTDLTNKLSIANNKINNLEAENVLIKNALNGVLTQLGKPNI